MRFEPSDENAGVAFGSNRTKVSFYY